MSEIMRYYLIYHVDASKEYNLYAYTSDKKEAKDFLKYRNESIVMKKKDVDSDERAFLCAKHGDLRVKYYTFKVDGAELKMPLSYREILFLEGDLTKTDIFLTGLANINPMIFKPKITRYLQIIRYNDFFLKYTMGTEINFDKDLFMHFIKKHGDTLDMKAIRKGLIT